MAEVGTLCMYICTYVGIFSLYEMHVCADV
jgi:hypothetical protein